MTAETVYHATPAERWAYFLLNADKLTPDDVCRLFPDQEFSEAAGVLEMISKTPEQLMEYHARLKFQLDEIARAKAIEYAAEEARKEALQEGRKEGIQLGLQEGREEGRQEGQQEGRQEGRQEGEEVGKVIGQLMGRIAVLQELLGQRILTADEFAACDVAQLTTIADQLQQQLRARNS